MNDRDSQNPDVDETDNDIDEAVISADDTGMLSEQKEILEAEIAQRLGTDPGQ
jgi:hypothetical protein